MKKMAIFVEGLTELKFIDRLLREVVSEKNLEITHYQLRGGKKNSKRELVRISAKENSCSSKEYSVIIHDSGTDNRVASDVRDQYESLVRAGYSQIIGVRDVRPDFSIDRIPILRRGLRYKMKTKPIDPLFVLSIMETEAWFLAEATHFLNIHPQLTTSRIVQSFGINPERDDMQLRPEPAQDLSRIYGLEGHEYNKRSDNIQRTIDALDYCKIYLEHRHRFPDLELFIALLDKFFSNS
jgi:hypothetical protein